MAIARLDTSDVHSVTNDSSASVTVPVGTTLAVLVVAGYTDATNPMTSGTVTLGGLSMTLQANAVLTGDLAAIWYLASGSIPTGTQTLDWNWGDTENFSDGGHLMLAYYSGVDTASPVRDQDIAASAESATSGTTLSTPTLTALTGDLVVAGLYAYDSTNPSSITWTNAASVHGAVQNGSWASLAEGFPSGNVAITADPVGNSGNDLWMALAAVVFKPYAGGTSILRQMMMQH